MFKLQVNASTGCIFSLFKSFSLHVLKFSVVVCTQTYRGQRTAFRESVLFFHLVGLGLELTLSGMVAGALTEPSHWPALSCQSDRVVIAVWEMASPGRGSADVQLRKKWPGFRVVYEVCSGPLTS